MKVVILAGGFGTRISEEIKPKPLVEIGGKPIIWHIMKIYSFYGINEFIICLGYKGNLIKKKIQNLKESWKIEFVNTGLKTSTAGRLKKIEKFVKNETFCFTYGDTLNNVNVNELIKFHKKNKKLATVTACHPPEKYGILKLNKNKVIRFEEKPKSKEWVNGGFFVLESKIFDYIKDKNTMWENKPMQELIKKDQLIAFQHEGFYKPMDTISDKNYLNKLWNSNKAYWKVWS